MSIGDSELREFTNGMLGHLAELLQEDFVPYLPSAVQAAIASCTQACLQLHFPDTLDTWKSLL